MMPILPPYKKLPISTRWLVCLLIMFMLVVWFQSGDFSITYLTFLFVSYVVWAGLLPFIQGLITCFNRSFNHTICALMQGLSIMSVHFFISNLLYYLCLALFVTTYEEPSISLFIDILPAAMASRGVDLIFFSALLIWSNQSVHLHKKDLELAEARMAVEKSKTQLLKSQLNSHFLFNTMHTISSTIGVDDDLAREVTIKISSLLRHFLQASEKTTYSLKEEMEILNEYLDIESIRFADRISIQKEVDESILNSQVPTILVQPLIENAFKHGVSQLTEPSKLKLSVKKQGDVICIGIQNDKPRSKGHLPSIGMGIDNLEKRLSAHYQKEIKLLIRETETEFYIELKLPLSI